MEGGRKKSIGPRISRGHVTPPLGQFVGKDEGRGTDGSKPGLKAPNMADRNRPERRSLSRAFRLGTPVYVKGKAVRSPDSADIRLENFADADDAETHDVCEENDDVASVGSDVIPADRDVVMSTSERSGSDVGEVSVDGNSPSEAGATSPCDPNASNGHPDGRSSDDNVADVATGDKLEAEQSERGEEEVDDDALETKARLSDNLSNYSDSLDSLRLASPVDENGLEKRTSASSPSEPPRVKDEVPGGSEAGDDHSDVISSHSTAGSVERNGRDDVSTGTKLVRTASFPAKKRLPLVRCRTLECRESGKQRQGQTFRQDSDPTSGESSPLASGPGPVTKETIASRLRYEKCHSSHEHEGEGQDYLTPTQRKDQALRDLKKQVKDLRAELEQREGEVGQLKASLGQESAKVYEMKEEELRVVRADLQVTRDVMQDLTEKHETASSRVEELEEEVRLLKEELERREQHHQQMYLEMYRKGQDSAKFEKDDEIEVLVARGAGGGASKELVSLLTRTQSELARWQALRRQEAYEEAERPETEAETTLAFLRDSFFHYLTDPRASDDHLRAMIRIFHYTSVEMKKVDKALAEWKKKKKKM